MSARPRPIRSAFLGFILLVTVIPAALFILFEEALFQPIVRRDLALRADITARAVSDGVGLFIDGILQSGSYVGEVVAASFDAAGLDGPRKSRLAEEAALAAIDRYAFIRSITALDGQGMVILAQPRGEGLIGTYLGDAPGLAELSGLGMSSAYVSPVDGRAAVAILSTARGYAFIIEASLESLEINRIRVNSVVDFDLRIMDARGVVVVGPEREVATRVNYGNLVRGFEGRSLRRFAIDGREELGLSREVEGIGWSVLVSWDRARFLAAMDLIRALSIGLTGLLIVAATAVAIRGSDSFARPLTGLAAFAASYASNDGGRIAPSAAFPVPEGGVAEFAALRESLELMRTRIEDREAGLRAALAQRDTLLKEVHHRVKNHLQIVSSMLGLQQGGLEDPGAIAALEESRRRVQALALIHETLYQTEDVGYVDFGSYLAHLVPEILSAYPSCADVRLDLALPDDWLLMPIDQAIPSGLIMGELVSNAAKHAFRAGKPGRLRVAAAREGELVYFEIEDDGPGFDRKEACGGTSLGIVLVDALAAQLKAELGCRAGNGCAWRVSFRSAPNL